VGREIRKKGKAGKGRGKRVFIKEIKERGALIRPKGVSRMRDSVNGVEGFSA